MSFHNYLEGQKVIKDQPDMRIEITGEQFVSDPAAKKAFFTEQAEAAELLDPVKGSVWVLYCSPEDPVRNVVGVFSTEEKAEIECARLTPAYAGTGAFLGYEEWEVR